MKRQVFAFSGIVQAAGERASSFDLVRHALSLSDRPRSGSVCYLPTGVGDSELAVRTTRDRFAAQLPEVSFSALTLFPRPSVSDVREHLLAQDMLLVEGGSVVNLMALWRAHVLPEVLRECWDTGVVLAGPSAGSICWHLGGPTDSFRDELDPFTQGLGLLPYSNGVHDDFTEQPRRAAYRRMVQTGQLPAGYATEDGVGLHYVDQTLHEAVTLRPGSHAWWVEAAGDGGVAESAVPARLL